MYTIEELVQNCYYGMPGQFPINWNVMTFLNVKYLILEQPVENPNLTLVNMDKAKKFYLYKYNNNLPRGFFVGKAEVIPDEYARLEKINSVEFDASQTAILEEKPSTDIFVPDSSSVVVADYNPNRLALNVYTDKNALLIISELFYPPGWKIYIDGKHVDKIYKTDHAVMSVIVPEGNHKVEVVCHPDSFFLYRNVSWASVGIIYLVLLLSLLFEIKNRKKVINTEDK